MNINAQPPVLSESPEFGFVKPAAAPRSLPEATGRKFWPRIPEFEVIDPDGAGMLLRARELEKKRDGSRRLGKLSTEIAASAWKQLAKFREKQTQRRHEQTKIRVNPELLQVEGEPTKPTLNASRTSSSFRRVWHSIERLVQTHQARKRLRLCETISLGEKRFIAVVQVDGKQLLVGGATNGLSVLANLESSSTFSNILQRRLEEGTRA